MSASTRYIAHLTCQHCNTISPKDTSTDLSNKVYEEEPGLDAIVEKGSVIEIDLEDIESDFIKINEPTTAQIRCIETWTCPSCRRENFAELIYLLRSNDAVIKDIKSIILTSKYLDEIHYLSERIGYWTRDANNNRIFTSLTPPQEEIQNFRNLLMKLQKEKKE